MPNSIFDSIFGGASSISAGSFLVCMATSLALGALLAAGYTVRSRCTKSFCVTVALLPTVVSVVIMLVNGNIGAGVAVAGAFGLVRFRSAPGTAKEIATVFIATCTGLLAGMGYLAFAAIFTLVMAAILLVLNFVKIRPRVRPQKEKTLRMTVPEDLDYTGAFDDLFRAYTESCETVSVKTANMGSVFKLKYNLVMKDPSQEKKFMDELRCRNGNLEIMISHREEETRDL